MWEKWKNYNACQWFLAQYAVYTRCENYTYPNLNKCKDNTQYFQFLKSAQAQIILHLMKILDTIGRGCNHPEILVDAPWQWISQTSQGRRMFTRSMFWKSPLNVVTYECGLCMLFVYFLESKFRCRLSAKHWEWPEDWPLF